jgi:sugar/nucleoside kinase (ribokinase family)
MRCAAQVPRLPPKDHGARRAIYAELVDSSPPTSQWEVRALSRTCGRARVAQYAPAQPSHAAVTATQVGGNTNFAIAAARLGLDVTCLGHTGHDVYGKFMEDVLAEEGVALQQLLGA